MSEDAVTDPVTPNPAPAPAPKPDPVIPNLPDPVKQLNEYDKALVTLAEEEKKLRDELGTKDPLEDTADTLEFASELLLVIRAIAKIKQERSAVLRRLASGFGGF